MEKSYSESYKAAGVDITAGYKAVELMKAHIARTVTEGAISGIGDFGGLFALDLKGMNSPVLVGGTDGVGTKLKIAFLMIHSLTTSITHYLQVGISSNLNEAIISCTIRGETSACLNF